MYCIADLVFHCIYTLSPCIVNKSCLLICYVGSLISAGWWQNINNDVEYKDDTLKNSRTIHSHKDLGMTRSVGFAEI